MTFELLVLLICIIGSSTYIHINPKFMCSLQVLLFFFFFFFWVFFFWRGGSVIENLCVASRCFLCCSAGKSFVAEILMLRRVISTGKIALLVLPYVSICAEKVLYWVFFFLN